MLQIRYNNTMYSRVNISKYLSNAKVPFLSVIIVCEINCSVIINRFNYFTLKIQIVK